MNQIYTLKESVNSIKSSSDLFNNIKKIKIDYTQENFIVFYLNTKNEIIKSEILFKGGLNSCVIDIKTIFRNALLNNANTLIVAHNHPSNDLKPSYEDEKVFRALKESGDILTLSVLDSVIFNKKDFYSMN